MASQNIGRVSSCHGGLDPTLTRLDCFEHSGPTDHAKTFGKQFIFVVFVYFKEILKNILHF